jgi:hypothetical protein
MFEEFSYKYESYFRAFFIVWVLGWSVVNGFRVLFNYSEFAVNNSVEAGLSPELGLWWFNTVGQVIGLAVGIMLIFWMASVPSRVAKRKKISSVGLFAGLAVVYYLFATIVDIFASAFFAPDTFAADLVFKSAWLLPSIIILILHSLYFMNLGKYNEELRENPQGVPAA